MHNIVYKHLSNLDLGWSQGLVKVISYVVALVTIGLLAFIVYKFTRRYVMKLISKLVKRSKNSFDDLLQEKKVFSGLAFIAPAIVLHLFSDSFGTFEQFVQNIIYGFVIITIVLTLFRGIDVMVQVYNQYTFSKGRPIKGVMQIVKIIIGCFGAGIVVVVFVGDATASVFLGSIGGLSAVIMLIFRDSILGFVAGIQLSTGQLLSIGDWLEMPKYGADGEVVDISLTKITVRNWDKTYTSVPAHKFLDDSFKNWEGMTKSGGRRIKRSVLIDIGTIGFLTEDQIKDLSKIDLIKDYISQKTIELDTYNTERNVDQQVLANGRRLTNIGTLRAYIQAYLDDNPNIYSEGFTLMVRQLQATETGVPLEIYCFSKDTAWVNFEVIQADIFDHILAVIPMFGLRVYQQPSGHDFKAIIK
jgi:miniconductance mechanosensitive channel